MTAVHMRSLVLVTASERREILAERLRMQGYLVRATDNSADGARLALSDPPDAVVADLWMRGISGVQLCRLLRAEPATEDVPVILCGPEQGQRHRFWAEKAGATHYVVSGRMGDLMRALERSVRPNRDDDFFSDFGEDIDIRDRMAAHLDDALFDSVLASEVRALGVCAEFGRLFDLFSQLVSRITSYRWLAVTTHQPARMGLHTHPSRRAAHEEEARQRLRSAADSVVVPVEDEDASDDTHGPPPIVLPIVFGAQQLGEVALAARGALHPKDAEFVRVLARELGGPLRIVSLVEESQRLAAVDPLTGLRNRRAFLEGAEHERNRAQRNSGPLTAILLDVDHFKQINDKRGHASGDITLTQLGALLKRQMRTVDIVGRWGGEEFVMVLPDTDLAGAQVAAERVRKAIEAIELQDARGEAFRITASIGVAQFEAGQSAEQLIDRADRAMYRAKQGGRNQVVIDEPAEALLRAVS